MGALVDALDASASTPDGRSTPSLDVPPALAPALIEPQALAALNAKFAPRFQALWAQSTFPAAGAPAAEPAGGPPGASPSKPPVSADRRFASREWQDLPYFAFLRDGYLLTSEYLNELRPSRRCLPRTGTGWRSRRGRRSTRCRRRTSPRPIPR